MLNHIIIQGRLTRDPELRRTQGGAAVASFTVAVERNAKAQDGTRQTDFIDCVAWRGAGEFVSKHFRKGNLAIVEGRLELRDWTDREGNKRRNAEINVASVYFCESKKSAADTGANNSAPAWAAGMPDGTADFSAMPDVDDDGHLPF